MLPPISSGLRRQPGEQFVSSQNPRALSHDGALARLGEPAVLAERMGPAGHELRVSRLVIPTQSMIPGTALHQCTLTRVFAQVPGCPQSLISAPWAPCCVVINALGYPCRVRTRSPRELRRSLFAFPTALNPRYAV